MAGGKFTARLRVSIDWATKRFLLADARAAGVPEAAIVRSIIDAHYAGRAAAALESRGSRDANVTDPGVSRCPVLRR